MRTQSALPRVRFASASAFHADLRRSVDGYFESTGKSPRANRWMRAKTAILLAWVVASYVALVFASVSPWARVLLSMSLGFAMAGVGFGVMHDANHGSYSHRPRVNRVLGFTLDVLGGSSYYWKQRHNVLHHTYTNVSGVDADLEGNALLRFAADQPLRPIQRYQHLYVWLLYGVYPLGWWLIDDFHRLATGRVGNTRVARPRGGELVAFLMAKVAFIGWAFVVPVAVHRSWAVVPYTLLAVATLGVTLATVFQLAHCVGEADFHERRAGELELDWAEHQVTTTVDFARGNALLGWYLGGLNYQVEHHLFPKVCHVHYRALAPIVEEVCARNGVRYRAQPSLRAAVAANVRWLRLLGSEQSPQPAGSALLNPPPGALAG